MARRACAANVRRAGKDQLHAVTRACLASLLLDPELLELGQVVDENPSHGGGRSRAGGRRPAGRSHVDGPSPCRRGPDNAMVDLLGTLDLVVDPGHRQAAFFADLASPSHWSSTGLMKTSATVRSGLPRASITIYTLVDVDLGRRQDRCPVPRTWFRPCRRPVSGCSHQYWQRVAQPFSGAGRENAKWVEGPYENRNKSLLAQVITCRI
jgi:hypothetical protein